jgi:hypothetical protein
MDNCLIILSNHNHAVLYNKNKNKLVHLINGTQNSISTGKTLYDWGNNLLIGTNHTRLTPRFHEEHDVHKKAVEKYKPKEDYIAGHSQGGSHTHELLKGKKGAKGITLNSAPTRGLFNTSKPEKNETKYRVASDPVSLNDIGLMKSQKTINANPFSLNLIKHHDLDNFKNEGIKIH